MMTEVLSIARVIIGVALLSVAAVSDLRTRTVSNKFWIVMGSTGLGILAVEILTATETYGVGAGYAVYDTGHYLILITIAILFFDVFWDREPVFGKKINAIPIILYVIALISAIGMLWLEGFGAETLQLLAIPIMIILGYLFYYTGLLHGGADAKAFMALAILYPFYLIIGDSIPLISYPPLVAQNLQLVFPFAFLIIMNAAIIQVIVVPLAMFFKNLSRKNFGFPEMLLGFKMNISEVPKKFVWPMEVIRENELVMVLFPRKIGEVSDELAELKKRDIRHIWVTPKVPFMVPMLFGLLFSIFVGNIIVLLF